MAINDPDNNNIVDLAKERKRQKTLHKKKRAESKNKKQGDFNRSGGQNLNWKSYLQFALFIALFAYFLQQCGR